MAMFWYSRTVSSLCALETVGLSLCVYSWRKKTAFFKAPLCLASWLNRIVCVFRTQRLPVALPHHDNAVLGATVAWGTVSFIAVCFLGEFPMYKKIILNMHTCRLSTYIPLQCVG
jgi:hypothetical protein